MTNKLEPILLQKQLEVSTLYHQLEAESDHPIARVLRGDYPLCKGGRRTQCGGGIFKNSLRSNTLNVIAEIKRKSPSKGMLASIADPKRLAQRYIEGGASAISILTDNKFFGGAIEDLVQVANALTNNPTPILRKDFIIDKVQIAEASVAGASAVLCIIAVLGKKTKELIEFANSIGIDVVVEIHDNDELKVALDSGAQIIGVNNRNLQSFEVDINCALEIVADIPSNIIKIAESGITDPLLARQYYAAGFDAVLIGEALVTSQNPEQFIRECRYG